jgi:urease accessory protein
VPIELKPDHLKIEPDHVLADMLRAMHLIVVAVDEAFEPEGGAAVHPERAQVNRASGTPLREIKEERSGGHSRRGVPGVLFTRPEQQRQEHARAT